MKFLFVIFSAMVLSPAAFGQSKILTPPPQNAPTSSLASPGGTSSPIAKSLGTLFSELEKKIIRETLGAATEAVTGKKVAPTEARHNDDDNEGHGAKNKHKRKGKHKGRGKHKGKKKGMPRGLAKRDSLPPGLQKQLERNGKLPPGLQKKALPGSVVAKLPPAQRGTERIIVDQDVVLIDTVTNTVLDIIKGVITK